MKHILIVDDQKMVTKVFSRCLVSRGYRTSVAHEGSAALDIARSETIDVLLTDFCMPTMHGAELMKQMRLLHPTLPVIFVTTYGDDIPVYPNEITAIFPKTVPLNQLMQQIEKMI